MRFGALSLATILVGLPFTLATPAISIRDAQAAPDNTVTIESATKFCMIVPRTAHTNIGDSEHPGGMTSYCSASARTSSSQGLFSDGWWTNVQYKKGKGAGDYVQLTGCINPSTLDRINVADAGGQYDSSGGVGGRGNPQGSVCTGYKHYVELIEPRGYRACIRCCQDPRDCPVNKDTQGCPSVIPASYNCGTKY